MTRETRIGLIVGLAFIVLFGVVLSELGTSGEAPEAKPDRKSRGFYASAPVTPPPQQRIERREVPLIARTQTPGSATAGAQQPPRRQQPAHTAGTAQTPPARTAQRPAVSAQRPAGSGDARAMTAEEFATAHGVGRRTDHGRMYVTRSGDNLTAIARKFYRTPSRKAVMKIFNANRNVLRTPDSLGVGVKIVIPN